MPAPQYSQSSREAAAEIPRGTSAAVVALTAAVGHLAAFGGWWNQDDWGLLARATGLAAEPSLPLRWLSRTAYWSVLEPLAHLDPVPYACTRLALIALVAAGVARLAQRLGMTTLQSTVAGLIVAGTPLAFTPLYWASGVQDLLALACGVWAIERGFAGGSGAFVAAVALGVAALASKETQLAVPLGLAWAVVARSPRSRGRVGWHRWLGVAVVTLAAIAALVLAWLSFSPGADEPYARGGAAAIVSNLGTYGWWLVSPGPLYAAHITLAMTVAGWAFWAVWAAWGMACGRQGWHVPLLTWACALAAIAPALPLARHVLPYLALPAAPFLALVLADLVPRRWTARQGVVIALVIGVGGWAILGMKARLENRDGHGLPADPVVQRTAVAYHAASLLRDLPSGARPASGLVLLQPPATAAAANVAQRLGERWVMGSLLHRSLEGTLGPRLILGADVPVVWANALEATPRDALVLVDAGSEFRVWGPTPQALFDLALTDVARGLFERARRDLVRAGALNGETVAFLFAPDDLPVPLAQVQARKQAFLDHLGAGVEAGRSRWEVAGTRHLFLQLLAACADEGGNSLKPDGPSQPSPSRRP